MSLKKTRTTAQLRDVVRVLMLAAAPTGAWAATEAQLLEHTAPESATSTPAPASVFQRLIDFPLMHPQFTLGLRSYGLANGADGTANQHTWATGLRLGVTFPEWHDWLSAGVAAYGSFPVGDTGPTPNRTLLVGADNKRLLAMGESYLNARSGNLNLRLFRQLLDAPYLNDQDNRMIPNVFQGYTLLYRTQTLYAGVGYISRMKARDSESYVSMAEAAGAKGSNSGATAAGVRWHPNKWLTGHAFLLDNPDVFSTAYLAADFDSQLAEHTDLRLSAQYTSQRSVGEERLGSFSTRTSGLKAALGYRRAVFTLAASTTGRGAAIRSPFGQRPTYLSLMLFDFDRADEDAWLAGVSYRLDGFGLPSWSFVVNHAEGHGAYNPASRAHLDDRRETDVTVDYRPKSGVLDGLWLRVRYAWASEGSRDLHQWRATMNYDIKPGKM
jgi:hypothetical protein